VGERAFDARRQVTGKPKSPLNVERTMSVRQADISQKPVSFRLAVATGRIRLKPETVKLIKEGKLEKGDPVAIAETMAVLATKKTPDMLALCHPLRIEQTQVATRLKKDSVEVTVTVSAHEKTGVEMEALTAVSVALLNIWDVTKAYEKDEKGQYPSTRIEDIHVVRKVKRS
jgi:cyclic pyranopterin phosphate synthase